MRKHLQTRCLRPLFFSVSSVLSVACLFNSSADAQTIDYLRDVKPMLAEKCFACHGALKQKGSLRVDSVAGMLEGGSAGASIVPGKSGESLLVQRVLGLGKKQRMPPKDEGEVLSDVQLAKLKAWIDQGAKGSADEKPEADPREHWAFKPPVKPTIPAGAHPLDALIANTHQAKGLTPQPALEPRLLLRRITLDLTGVPPTLEEQEAFLKDTSLDAYEKVVDRLLASPRYGQRWGRHWMDIWRYSDWYGLGKEVRNSQKHIWHWRDWIIESVNDDKGYDQMLREMLAADELYPTDLQRLRASGFLARQYFKFNRTTWLDDTIEHTSKAFLGLTLNCAKCHAHKYDPLPQEDFYRFRAIFEPYQIRTDQLPGETNFEQNGLPRAFDFFLDAPTYLFTRGEESQPVKDAPLEAGVPKILAFKPFEVKKVTLPLEGYLPSAREYVLENYVALAQKQIAAAEKALEQAKKSGKGVELAEKSLAAAQLTLTMYRAQFAADRARGTPEHGEWAKSAARLEKEVALAQAEEAVLKADAKTLAAAKDAVVKAKAELAKPGVKYTSLRAALKTPASNLESGSALLRPFPETSTGRRSALADWLTDRRHPLTARVAVNHLWGRHFGQPLVATVFDFGRKGATPSHPEVLDFLATELMDRKWSTKHIHRLIVTSQAYRRTSSSAGASAKNLEVDPENRLLWRMNAIRMEAQTVRDSLLHLAGDLDFALGGPSIPVNEETKRRSLYYVHSFNDSQKFLSMFDDALVRECYRRTESIIPQQALTLANSKLSLTQAQRIAERLKAVGDEAFIRAAFQHVLACEPTSEETTACLEALAEWRGILKGEKNLEARVRADLVHALINHNDFVTVR